MTQKSIVLSTTPPFPGPDAVAAINNANQALATDFAGPDDPAALAGPYMTWADTGNMLLKRRNAAGTAWVTLGPLFGQSTSARRVMGLAGNANGSAPLTKFDLSADAVVSADASGWYICEQSVGNSTVDFGLAGPVINGRDQSGAFAANSWVNIYRIHNPTTSTGAWIASLAAPTVGPALPSDYTRWAYATTIKVNASGNIIPASVDGARVRYDYSDNNNRILSNGTSLSMVTLDCSAYIPPSSSVGIFNFFVGVSGGAGAIEQLYVRKTGWSSTGIVVATAVTQVNNQYVTAVQMLEFPVNQSKQIDYKISLTPGAGGASIEVSGYLVPNGDA